MPRPGSGQSQSARNASEPRGQLRPAGAAPDAPAAVVFDANGDGVIESWSFAHGGDSFATFDPPPSASSASGGGGAKSEPAARSGRTADHATGHTTSPAAIHHARRSYQQDGLASQPPAPAHSAPAPSTPAPSTPAPPAPSPPAGGHSAGTSA